ncbi:MAG: ABC-F family ATP-binding cassette domain-containing protein [Actinomycetota bacterium]|nr:ABC-F family ATP-binding cassette domain-containing protein [Actinomycetota bacterium]
MPIAAHANGAASAGTALATRYGSLVVAVLVDLQRVSVRTADRALFEDLSLTVSEGERLGVVGINGTGKSTLLRVLSGLIAPEGGRVLRGRGARIGYVGQEEPLPPGRVREVVGGGWEGEAALGRLGMGGTLEDDVRTLSGGQRKRVALARVLVHEAELLVLDEPTNHLDLAAVAWLERRLSCFKGGLVLVSHDRHLLDRLTTRMVELDRGRGYVHEGGYSAYLEAKAVREEQSATAEATRRNLARRELAWLRRGAPARTRKSKARIDAATELIERRPDAPARSAGIDLALGTTRLGDDVISCAGVAYTHPGSDRPVVSAVDLELDRRERLAIVGPNGSGKTTLLDLLAGRREPSAGRIERGATVALGYYDQHGAELDPALRVREVVAGPHRAPGSPEDVALMERFWFAGELAFAPVGTLSGGERRRLQLLVMLADRPNVVLLDEPTNDLDLDTIRIVEDFFDDWPGALVVVSHDRTFLERTVERVCALRGDGTLAGVPGGVAGWLAEHEAPTPTPPSSGRANPGRAAGRAPAPAGRARSASTLSHQLRQLDKQVAALTRRRDALVAELAGASDHLELARIGTALSHAQAELDDAEERWLRLAEEAEAARS